MFSGLIMKLLCICSIITNLLHSQKSDVHVCLVLLNQSVMSHNEGLHVCLSYSIVCSLMNF